MNWYRHYKISSAREEKQLQLLFFGEKIREAIDQAMIGGEETTKIIQMLIDKLKGKHGFRNLITPSISRRLIDLLNSALKVKKDSPHKFCAILEEALTYLL